MKLKIRITTPKGQARKIERQISPLIIGRKKNKVIKTYINDDNSEMFWDIETEARKALKITRNVAMYENMMKTMLNHKQVRKRIKKDQEEELNRMLFDQTKIEVIKEATAQEMVEVNKTYWERIKEKFKKI